MEALLRSGNKTQLWIKDHLLHGASWNFMERKRMSRLLGIDEVQVRRMMETLYYMYITLRVSINYHYLYMLHTTQLQDPRQNQEIL